MWPCSTRSRVPKNTTCIFRLHEKQDRTYAWFCWCHKSKINMCILKSWTKNFEQTLCVPVFDYIRNKIRVEFAWWCKEQYLVLSAVAAYKKYLLDTIAHTRFIQGKSVVVVFLAKSFIAFAVKRALKASSRAVNVPSKKKRDRSVSWSD